MPAQIRMEVDGGAVQDIQVNDGGTVGDVMAQHGLSPEALDVLVNGQLADMGRTLNAGDTVLAVPKQPNRAAAAPAASTQAARNFVRVGKFPGKPVDLDVAAGTTVRAVLQAANLNPQGFDVRKNGVPVELDEVVTDGDAIALYRPVQGNVEIADDDREIEAEVRISIAA